ncbi:MAG: PAS domain S-box protein [Mariprofundus sp.]|nr:PAS domain S-box protein [Mariprofundus sp.]
MLKRLSMAHLGILVGVLYWPAEALIHDFIFGQGSFMDNLLGSDSNEIWMRTLISTMFIGFGIYARKAVVHQQQLQEQLRKKSERLHQIIDCTYDAYVSMDRNGVITGWNRSAEALFGWPRSQITGQQLDVIIPERLRDDHHQGIRRYQQDSIGPWLYKPVRTQALHQDGFEFSIEMVVTPIKSDGADEFFAFIREQEH